MQRAVLAEVRPEWDTRHLLTKLAEHAQRFDTAVLMTIDELHSGDRDELRRFSADLQHITKRAHWPLAIIVAGLSEMKHTLLMDKKMTFFRRCARFDMPALTTADALAGLRIPVLDSGGGFENDALESAARACGPLPYEMQLIGYHAWTIAGAPRRPIDLPAVEQACNLAGESMVEDLIVPAWHDLSRSQQAFLGAVADAGGQARPEQLGATLPYSFVTLADTEQRLLACGYLAATNDGALRLTELMPTDAVRRFAESPRRYQSPRHAPATGTFPSARCGHYMPRAKAHCILPEGHGGGHRSGSRRRA